MFRYSLRTLVILTAVVPPTIAGIWLTAVWTFKKYEIALGLLVLAGPAIPALIAVVNAVVIVAQRTLSIIAKLRRDNST